jgi:hypothetical protein
VQDAELAVDVVQQAIISSCHQNYPATEAPSLRTVPWWNQELINFKAPKNNFLIKLKEKVTGKQIRRPSPVTIKNTHKRTQ